MLKRSDTMSHNTFGHLFRVTTWGESHGPALGCVVDGCPPRLALSEADVQPWLDRRRPGQSRHTTQRQEADQVQILSGVYEGLTTGTPIMMMIANTDQRSRDYREVAESFRPGHADLSYTLKYGIRDPRGGGRSSARETAARVAAAAHLIALAGDAPGVVDPVMTAKGGASLLARAALERLKAELVPRAALLTPNAPEAEALTGLTVQAPEDLRRAGDALLGLGARAVLMKGGHLPGERVVDWLMTPSGETRFESGRIDSRHTHGTGCTLASAIAVHLAQGRSLETAVERARDYLRGAILHAPGLGAGHGPIGHGWAIGR